MNEFHIARNEISEESITITNCNDTNILAWIHLQYPSVSMPSDIRSITVEFGSKCKIIIIIIKPSIMPRWRKVGKVGYVVWKYFWLTEWLQTFGAPFITNSLKCRRLDGQCHMAVSSKNNNVNIHPIFIYLFIFFF